MTSSAKVNELYTAIHIDKSTKTPIWEASASKVGEAYLFEEMTDYTEKYDDFLGLGYKTLIYAGQWDQRDGPVTLEPWLKNVKYLQKSTIFV